MKTIREKTWIWGHPAGALSEPYHLPPSRMTVTEAAYYFGVRNAFFLPMFRDVNITQCNKAMCSLEQVGWALEYVYAKPDVIDRLFEQAGQFPNISCGIFDDFFNEENVINNQGNYSPAFLSDLRNKLHTRGPRPLEMWLVLYTKQFGKDYSAHIREFDGVTLWFWWERELENYEANCEKFFAMTPANKRMIGIYLYDFGTGRPADPGLITMQLDCCRRWMRKGLLEGIILHSNAVCDLELEAVDTAKAWFELHGNEPAFDECSAEGL